MLRDIVRSGRFLTQRLPWRVVFLVIGSAVLAISSTWSSPLAKQQLPTISRLSLNLAGGPEGSPPIAMPSGADTKIVIEKPTAPPSAPVAGRADVLPNDSGLESSRAFSAAAPVIYKIPTAQPVVFLGIDDGWTKSPGAHDWLVQHKLPFTLFLTDAAIKNNYDYFETLRAAGMAIQDHSLSHPNLKKLTPEQQKTEICGAADTYQTVFGTRPTLFRPPYGLFNDTTRQVVRDCGLKAIVMWNASLNGGSLQLQDDRQHLQPGDIVLMHFRPEFMADIKAFMAQVQADNLQVGRLEDWIE